MEWSTFIRSDFTYFQTRACSDDEKVRQALCLEILFLTDRYSNLSYFLQSILQTITSSSSFGAAGLISCVDPLAHPFFMMCDNCGAECQK